MLTKDPEKRSTLNDLISHPWVTKNGAQPLGIPEMAPINPGLQDMVNAIVLIDDQLNV
jgi:hypothetical protein